MLRTTSIRLGLGRGILLMIGIVSLFMWLRLQWNSQFREVDWQENWLLAAVIWSKNFCFFAGDDTLAHVCCSLVSEVVISMRLTIQMSI